MFSDDFTAPDSVLGARTTIFRYLPPMRLRPPAGAGALIVYEGVSFRDADICVDVTIPEKESEGSPRRTYLLVGQS